MLHEKRTRRTCIVSLNVDVRRMIFRWMQCSTLLAASCVSKGLRVEILDEARVLLDNLVASASTWRAFVYGGATIYKLARFVGLHVNVPHRFVEDFKKNNFRMFPPPITIQAFELMYLIVGEGWRSGNIRFDDPFFTGVYYFAECQAEDYKTIVRREHVECAIHLLIPPRRMKLVDENQHDDPLDFDFA